MCSANVRTNIYTHTNVGMVQRTTERSSFNGTHGKNTRNTCLRCACTLAKAAKIKPNSKSFAMHAPFCFRHRASAMIGDVVHFCDRKNNPTENSLITTTCRHFQYAVCKRNLCTTFNLGLHVFMLRVFVS